MERTIAKNFNNFLGRDIRSSDLVRDKDYAIEFQNARVVKEDSCVNREGFKVRRDSGAYEGLYTYRYSDITTGDTLEELIFLSDDLYKKTNSTFTVAYGGVATPVLLSIRLDTTTLTYKCVLNVANVDVLSYDLGNGFEATPITLANLKTQIDAVTSFTATIVGTTTFPAAFLPITITQNLNTASAVLNFYEPTKMSTLNTTIFNTYHSNRGLDSWELASVVNANNNLYIGTGYEYLHKYDGQNVYRAGMPFADTVPTLSLGGTGFTDTNIKYLYLYKQIDNRGNVIYGVDSDPSALVSPANQTVSVTVKNILAGSGFNTGCALVNGNQVGVTTITVTNSPHTFKVNDKAYFLDRSSATYVERNITAVTATTITIDGAVVNVNNTDVISNNLRIVIYRTTNGGSLYYKVVEIPNNSFTATQVYADGTAFASIPGQQYIPPIKSRDILGVKPRYLCMHQDLLIISGAFGEANTWRWSSGEGVEYFPADSNFNDIANTSGGGIRGLGSDQEHLIIGTNASLFVVTGDIASDNARQEKLTERNVGFACHNSIVDIGDRIIFLAKTGFWSIQNGFNLEEIGAPINPDIVAIGYPDSEIPQLRRSYGVYFETTQEYVCFVPTESGTSTAKFVNTSAKAHVYDTFHNAWCDWTGLNMGGGLTVFEDNLFFQSKRDDSVLTVTGNLWERNMLGVVDDYADQHVQIAFKLGTQWMDGGEPSVFKVFLWLKVYNLLRQLLSATFALNVQVEKDYQRDVAWAQFELDFGTSSSSLGWGYFPWGLSPWGSPRVEARKKKLKSGKAESIRYVMTNENIHEKVAISAWETVITNPYAVEMKD